MNFFTGIIQPFLNLLFPGRCLICGRELENSDFICLCLRCSVKICRPAPGPLCMHCSHPLEQGRCPSCIIGRFDPLWFRLNVSFGLYQGEYKKLLYIYKFQKQISLARPLAVTACKHYYDFFRAFDCFIPVPCSPERKREREFCQAEEFTRQISRICGKPLLPAIGKHSSVFRAQHKKNFSDRLSTAHQDFYLKEKFLKQIKGKKLLLFDDIFTTGSTANACARLLTAGNGQIGVFTLARTVKERPEEK
ncbi:MAG: hypothetical protein A2096_13345 [Spirochaetes bacterium GWF1_41_5]|nr:MAG: hypothetical protein A2096_13345 [Spirochaetes bacterium GWF1_41_5]HBE01226.1 hypothetical protein [Spirochaetia bacterium]